MKKSMLGCMNDPCFKKITISHNGKDQDFYCELEKGHKGNHQSSLIWE